MRLSSIQQAYGKELGNVLIKTGCSDVKDWLARYVSLIEQIPAEKAFNIIASCFPAKFASYASEHPSQTIERYINDRSNAIPPIEKNPVVRLNEDAKRKNAMISIMQLEGVSDEVNNAIRERAYAKVPPALRIDTTKKLITSYGSGKNALKTLSLEIS